MRAPPARVAHCRVGRWSALRAANDAKISLPRAHFIRVLAGEHPRNLHNVIEVVCHPRRQKLSKRHHAQFRMPPETVEIHIGQVEGAKFAEVGLPEPLNIIGSRLKDLLASLCASRPWSPAPMIRGQAFFEPVVRVRLVVEGIDLVISRAAVEGNRLCQGVICLEPKDSNSSFTGMPLQFLKKPPPDTESPRGRGDPHSLQLRRGVSMKFERTTADRPFAQAGDEQRAGRRHEFVRVGGNTERRIEARIEAFVELRKILLKAPSGIGRCRILNGEMHHRRL